MAMNSYHTRSTHASPGAKLRALMNQGIVMAPGAFNALSARLIQQQGFDAAYISGAGVTNSMLGAPDIGLITLTEMAEQCSHICRSVDLPCVADADTGYGDVHQTMRAVKDFERAGLAGLHLEDQVFPKRCGHLDGKAIVSIHDMCAKIRAACAARHDSDFLVIARTDARAVEGFEAAVERANAYREAGADMIFPEALQSAEEFAAFAKETSGLLMANMTEFGKSPLLELNELSAMGYRLVIYPMTQLRVIMKAAEQALVELKSLGTQSNLLDRMQTRAELYDLLDYSVSAELDKTLAQSVRSTPRNE